MKLRIREVKTNDIEHANASQKKVVTDTPSINIDTIKNCTPEMLMERLYEVRRMYRQKEGAE